MSSLIFLSLPGERFINFIDLFNESAFGFVACLCSFLIFNFIDFCSNSYLFSWVLFWYLMFYLGT